MAKQLQSSTKFAILVSLFIFIILCPHQSLQQDIISKSSIIQATCVYNYTSDNIYTCNLSVPGRVNRTHVLEITGNHLPNHTDDDVEAVIHGFNIVEYFNGEVLRKFMNLKRIRWFGASLQEINPEAFYVCPKLERLEMNNGNFFSFPAGLLKNCQNLILFQVMSTNVQTFPEDFFGNTQNLETFDASVNRLSSLPEKLLQNMSNLRVLRISYNRLTELSPNFLINARNLEEVAAHNNEFRHQNDIAFALNGRTNLKILWLEDNEFANFDFRFFTQFQQLEYLSIGKRSSSMLTNINWQSLPSSLTDLRVFGSGEEIPENAFERTANLNTLILDGRNITSFQKGTFKPLTNLVFLYFYDTGLKTLHPEQFTSQSNLSTLLIMNSQLEELPVGVFVPLVNIGIANEFNSLQVIYSKLRRLNANSFGQHPHLRNIDFLDNEINEIERGIFSKFHPNMTFAGFNKNRCVSETFSGENLDNHAKLEVCFRNWEEIDPNDTTAAPGGTGRNFQNFEIIAIIFVGFFNLFIDLV